MWQSPFCVFTVLKVNYAKQNTYKYPHVTDVKQLIFVIRKIPCFNTTEHF